jgi:hypothetical protein
MRMFWVAVTAGVLPIALLARRALRRGVVGGVATCRARRLNGAAVVAGVGSDLATFWTKDVGLVGIHVHATLALI